MPVPSFPVPARAGVKLAPCLLALAVAGCQLLPDAAVEDISATRMSCGERTLSFSETKEGLALTLEGEDYRLKQVESASGSQYVAMDDSSTQFWSRGERGLMTVNGEELPECVYASGDVLSGPVWTVVELSGERVLTNYQASMHFKPRGRVGGRSSCNHFTASWERIGDRVIIQNTETTRMACPTEVMEQEKHFLSALSAVSGFDLMDNGHLLLHDAEGDALIRARARATEE